MYIQTLVQIISSEAFVIPVKLNSMSFEVVESPSVMVSPFPSIALSVVSTTIGSSIVQINRFWA